MAYVPSDLGVLVGVSVLCKYPIILTEQNEVRLDSKSAAAENNIQLSFKTSAIFELDARYTK